MKYNNNLKNLMSQFKLTNAIVKELLECEMEAVVSMKCGNQRFNNRDETHLMLKLKQFYENNLRILNERLNSQ